MKELKSFSIEEMSVLEALDVKGGTAELAAVTQKMLQAVLARLSLSRVRHSQRFLPFQHLDN